MVAVKETLLPKCMSISGAKIPCTKNVGTAQRVGKEAPSWNALPTLPSASSLKLYMREEDADMKKYMKIFLIINVIVLAALIPTYYIFN